MIEQEQGGIQIGLDVIALFCALAVSSFFFVTDKDLLVRLAALIVMTPCAMFTIFIFTSESRSGLL